MENNDLKGMSEREARIWLELTGQSNFPQQIAVMKRKQQVKCPKCGGSGYWQLTLDEKEEFVCYCCEKHSLKPKVCKRAPKQENTEPTVSAKAPKYIQDNAEDLLIQFCDLRKKR